MNLKAFPLQQLIKKILRPAVPLIKKVLPASWVQFLQRWVSFFLDPITLHLIRSDLKGLPSSVLPAGYSWASLQTGPCRSKK